MDCEQRGSKQDTRYQQAALRFASAIERLARGYEADPELRRDLVQEIHTALWLSFRSFAGQCSERTWVYRVAHNTAASHAVRYRRYRSARTGDAQDLEAAVDTRDVEDETGVRLATDRLFAAVHAFKSVDRQVVLLYLEGLPATEIADVTGLSAGAVAVRLHRSKALLAARFRMKGEAE